VAVAHDASSRHPDDTEASGSHAGDWSWTHTPVGTPRGVTVAIVQNGSGFADDVTGVTYGGTAMTRVRRDARTDTEQGATYLYFLGESIPTGAQTVAITAGTVPKAAGCVTTTAAADTEVDSHNGADLGIVANPSVTVTHTGTLAGWFGMAAHFSGRPAPPSPGSSGIQSGITYAFGTDMGAASAMFYYRTAPADAASSTYGYDTLASEDQLISAVVIKEAAGGVTGTLDATLPALTADLAADVTVTGQLAGQIPALEGSAQGKVTVTGQVAATLPAMTAGITAEVAVSGTLAGQLPALTADLTGEVTVSGQLAGTLPALTADITGDFVQDITGTLDAALPALTASLQGEITVEAILAAELPALQAAITAETVTAGPTPAERTLTVAAEDRTYVVPAEDRVYAVSR